MDRREVTRRDEARRARALVDEAIRMSGWVDTGPRGARERTKGPGYHRFGEWIGEHRRKHPNAHLSWRQAQGLWWGMVLSCQGHAHHRARRALPWMASFDEGDLHDEALIGTYEAAVRYDPEKGISFLTYARWWVDARLQRVTQRDHLVRIPGFLREAGMIRISQELNHAHKNGETLTRAELAERSGLSVQQVEILQDTQIASIDQPLARTGDGSRPKTLHDMLADKRPGPDAQAEDRVLLAKIRVSLELLPARSRKVLLRKYAHGHTQSAIARGLNVSRERVYQILRQAERAVRDHFLGEEAA